MFNAARFNLTRFNLRASEEEIIYSVLMTATMHAMVGSGQNVHETVFMHANVNGLMHLGAGTLFAARLGDAVAQNNALSIRLLVQHALAEGWRYGGTLGLTSYQRLPYVEAVNGAVTLGGDFFAAFAMDERIEAAPSIGSDLYLMDQLMSVFWQCQVTTIRFTLLYAYVNVTIPPGGSLVIDSSGYVVLLDGENIIDRHSGDWLWLTRDTFDVVVEPLSGGGALATELLYTERWL